MKKRLQKIFTYARNILQKQKLSNCVNISEENLFCADVSRKCFSGMSAKKAVNSNLTASTPFLEYYDGSSWQTVAKVFSNVNNLLSSVTNYTLLATDQVVITNNPSAPVLLTLPTNPSIGQKYTIIDGAGVSNIYPVTVQCTGGIIFQSGVFSNPTMLNTIPVGSNPEGVAITPNGNYAYVVNNTGNTVTVLQNVSTNNPSVYTTFTGLNGPISVAITPNGNYAYITNFNGNSVTVIQNASATPSVLSTITGINNAFCIAITPNGNYVYVTNPNANTVTIIPNASSGGSSSFTTLSTGGGTNPNQIAITPNGNYAYVVNYNGNSLTVIQNASSGTPSVLTTLSLAANSGPYGIAITPNGNYAYVTCNTSGIVNVIQNVSTSSPSVSSATVSVGNTPQGIAITPNGNYAYVASRTSNYVTILQNVSAGSPAYFSKILTNNGPYNIAITPNGNYAYVTNYNTANTVSILQAASNASNFATISNVFGSLDLIYNGTVWYAE